MNSLAPRFAVQFRLFDARVLLPAVYFWSLIIRLYNPLEHQEFTSFDRVIGHGVIHGVNVEARVAHFYLWYLFIMPVSFALIYFMLSKLSKRHVDLLDGFRFCKIFSLVSLASSAIFIFNLFNSGSVSPHFVESLFFSSIILGSTFTYLLLLRTYGEMGSSLGNLLRKYVGITMPFAAFKWCLVIAFASAFPFSLLMNATNQLLLVYGVNIWLFVVITEVCLRSRFVHHKGLDSLRIALLPLLFSPLALAVFLEGSNILNQYDLFIVHRLMWAKLICLALFLFSVILFIGHNTQKHLDWERIYYPVLLIGISFLVAIPAMQTLVETDLFEQSNHGMLVSDFLRYNKIPIIESFDAHMLSQSLWGILYGLINHDIFGAPFVLYSPFLIVVTNMLSYKLLAKIFGHDYAFLIVLLLPVPLFINFAILSVLTLLYAAEKNSCFSYFIYWLSVVIIVLYEAPLGFAAGLATTLTFLLLRFFHQKKGSLKKFLIALFGTLSSCILIYLSVCKVQGIAPLNRLKELLAIMSSSNNWGYSLMGDPNKFSFQFAYVLLPIFVLAVIAYAVKLLKNNDEPTQLPSLLIVLSLSFAFFINIQRGMVRHSLVEMTSGAAWPFIGMAIIAIAIAISVFFPKFKKELFVSIIVLLTLSTGIIIESKTATTNLLTTVSKRYTEKKISPGLTEKVPRAVPSEKFKATYTDIAKAINLVMTDDETYLDFTNQTFLYELAGKEKPVIVNQSPGHLSGEFSQEQFLNEIETFDGDVDFALLPTKSKGFNVRLDWIANAYRYYKVSEYISLHYKPVFTIGSYAIWCNAQSFDRTYRQIAEIQRHDTASPYTLIDYQYGDAESLHDYQLEDLPYLWGMKDDKEAYLNKPINVLKPENDQLYRIGAGSFSKEKGNYLLIEADAKTDGKADLLLLASVNDRENQLARFNFAIKAGEKCRYLIRVSADFNWYTGDVNALSLKSEVPLENVIIKLLEGD